MRLRTIKSVKNLHGKKVVLRIDANVPLHDGEVVDDFRLRSVIPTLQFLIGRGAIIIIIAHLGRPEGHKNPKYTLLPVARKLTRLLGKPVSFVPDLGGPLSRAAVAAAVDGQVFMLENLRFDKGEESNSGSLAKKIASLGDVYVNDGFGVSHRAHASVSAITRYLPAYAGLLMEKELRFLGYARLKPASPSLAIVGGAKIGTKICVIKNLAKRYDQVLVGGGLINPLLVAKKFGIGASLIEPKTEKLAEQLLRLKNVSLPVDVLVGNAVKPDAPVHIVPIASDRPFVICRKPEGIVDIGPRTILAWANVIKKAKTIVWNGPLGIFEVPRFSHGTIALARLIASRSKGRAMGIVGGGETVEALDQTKMSEWVDHISTGGGAMVEYLEGKTLPGVKPLYFGTRK